jgi:pimeloyl-ACP methyl ester carboxylesterase
MRWRVVAGVAAIAVIAVVAVVWPRQRAHSTYTPKSAALRRPDIFLYAPRSLPPTALVFFFGNDIGFWQAHQEIAEFLADNGYAVAGLNVRPLLATLPDAPNGTRDSVIAKSLEGLIAESRAEFQASDKPLVLMGHSLGAEIAVWAAANVRAPGLAGVVAISTRSRGHLRATLADIANKGEPTEPGSFSIPGIVRSLPANVRIALVRGDHDKFRSADTAIVAAGGSRVERMIVPFASHSLKSVFVARYIIRRAVGWVVARASK